MVNEVVHRNKQAILHCCTALMSHVQWCKILSLIAKYSIRIHVAIVGREEYGPEICFPECGVADDK